MASYGQLSNGFKIISRMPMDARLILSKKEMLTRKYDDTGKTIATTEAYFCVCKDDHQFYIYDSTKPQSETTGYYHPYGLDTAEAEDGQILIAKDGKWVPIDFVDGQSIILLDDNGGIEIKGYQDAEEGQMLVKHSDGVAWVAAASTEAIQQAVTQAYNYAAQAAISAAQAKNYAEEVANKYWFGTMDEYRALPEIDPDRIYVILDGDISFIDE